MCEAKTGLVVPRGINFSLFLVHISPALHRMKIRAILDKTNKREDGKLTLWASFPPLLLLLPSSGLSHHHRLIRTAPIFLFPEPCYPRPHCLSHLLARVWGHSILPSPLLHLSTEWVQLLLGRSSLLENVPPKAGWPKGEDGLPR